VAVTLAFALLFSTMAVADPANQPEDIVRDTVEKVLVALRAEPELKEHPGRANAIIEEFVVPHFDFRLMSKLVLQEHWNQATSDERMQFTKEFQTLLVRTYALALTDYRGQQVRIVSQQRVSDKNVRVRAEIIANSPERISMLYDMLLIKDNWKVVDVRVNNLSLVKNHRASYRKEVEENDMAGLITRIAAQNWEDGS
jgi:phospholipid transport system substrate-binding protein